MPISVSCPTSWNCQTLASSASALFRGSIFLNSAFNTTSSSIDYNPVNPVSVVDTIWKKELFSKGAHCKIYHHLVDIGEQSPCPGNQVGCSAVNPFPILPPPTLPTGLPSQPKGRLLWLTPHLHSFSDQSCANLKIRHFFAIFLASIVGDQVIIHGPEWFHQTR